MTVPHITQNHYEKAWSTFSTSALVPSSVTICNKAIEIALAEQATEQPLITAEEARKLVESGSRAQWLHPDYLFHEVWLECAQGVTYSDRVIKYRGIKPQAQPEPVELTCTRSHPHELMSVDCQALTAIAKSNNEKRCAELRAVEPHADLKALYAQQVKNTAEGKAGGLDDFVWQVSDDDQQWHDVFDNKPLFEPYTNFHCTPKPTCQVRNLDTDELKTMTREAAKLLQAETKDVCDWFDPAGVPHHDWCFGFNGIYTYKLKAKLVKLDGKLMPREAAIAEWESKKDTCDLWFKPTNGDWALCQPDFYHMQIRCYAKDGEYQLREKPKKQVTLDPAIREGVIALLQELNLLK